MFYIYIFIYSQEAYRLYSVQYSYRFFTGKVAYKNIIILGYNTDIAKIDITSVTVEFNGTEKKGSEEPGEQKILHPG